MMAVFYILFFSVMVAIKGGLVGHIAAYAGKAEWWKQFSDGHWAINFLTEGKVISAILSGAFIATQTSWLVGLLFAAAWFTGWIMSVGEEIGAIGRFGYHHGPYVDWLGEDEGRELGWKKGLHRGVFLGACLALAMYSIPTNEIIIIACALFPAVYFVGNNIYYRINKSDSWFYSEFLFGAVIGAILNLIIA